MTKDYALESILAVDCGSVWTRALLIDVVEGRYRLVARGEALSTTCPPQTNAMLGAARAIMQIENMTGRRLLDNKCQLITPERPDGSGTDAFVATASAASPLRVFLLGLAGEVSVASARRAAAGCGAEIVDVLSLEDGLEQSAGVEMALARFDHAAPDAVVIVGGVNGSTSRRALDMVRVLTLAYEVAEPGRRPPVVYAGNPDLSDAIVSAFGSLAEVKVVDNVRPSMEVENLAPLAGEMQNLYTEWKLHRVPGMGAVAAWSRVPLMATMQAQGHVLRYLSGHYNLNVAGLELSASRSTVSWALGGQSTFMSNMGGVAAGSQVAERVGLDNVLRWLPEEVEPDEAWTMIRNLSLFAGTVPGSAAEVAMTQALARAALLPLVAGARPLWKVGAKRHEPAWDLIVLAGATLTNMGSPGQSALLALDVLQPEGVCGLVMDSVPLAPALGALAGLEPLAAAQVLDQDGFVSLGTVIAPRGAAHAGDVALRVKITYADGRTLQVEVPAGSLEVIPLAAGQKATLQLRPGRRFDLGWARRSRNATVEVDGGLLGVIVDARGRPLPTVGSVAPAQWTMRQWLWEIGG